MGPNRKIILSTLDHARLTEILDAIPASEYRLHKELQVLAEELRKADVVSPHEIPEDAVTMNSSVVIRDLDTDELETYTIVFPEEADPAGGRMSILAPLAIALIGYRAKDTVAVRAGLSRVRIESLVYQPERAGHFDR